MRSTLNFKHTGKYIFLTFIIALGAGLYSQENYYPWLGESNSGIETRIEDITVPEGYEREEYPGNSFRDWLRHLPLKKDKSIVKLYNGSAKGNQEAHFRIIDIDVGEKDLQQCADAVMRLYAEYLYSRKRQDLIAYNFTSGDRAEYKQWVKGFRPLVKGNDVSWRKSEKYDKSYRNFRKYMEIIFTYAGSYSLSKELRKVNNIKEMETGDIFIEGGFPGHAVIIVDMAVHKKTKDKIFMIAQSYMPAQEVHILNNPEDKDLSPWYEIQKGEALFTPEWTFKWSDLKKIR